MTMEYESHNWIWMDCITATSVWWSNANAALLGLSTTYFGGIGHFPLSYVWSDSGVFHKKCEKKRIRALGDELVVGVVSDEEIIANKGPPVLPMEERLALVSGLKWVDQVIANAPYAITEQFMNTGRYKQIKRTEGVSSTDIVGRILSSLKDTEGGGDNTITLSSGDLDPQEGKAAGGLLLVGVHTDHIVREHRGVPYPVMHVHERCLSVLACRFVDEVIIGAPWEITKDMITTFNISIVVHGTVAESNTLLPGETDPYAVPKRMGIFRFLESPKSLTTSSVSQRIVTNREAYMKRNAKKTESEKKYYEEKTYVAGE
ncbi:putative EF-hand domain-containing protein 1 [Hibiscus syriacus]|uniref:ethanolamine-phosphate cytidylyltransferase n=1 Tax=Hibiscus syriacus TaxID=106335 RepID=A0A6A3BYL0_HIBSY|nr:putative EF-hand domain-containing protein 1 [Hibiscus syriacus]